MKRNTNVLAAVLLSSALSVGALAGASSLALAESDSEATDREVVCWGDSLTKGSGADTAVISTPEGFYDASFKSYPEILEDLCGLTTYNYGASGATSRDILRLQEGVIRDYDSDYAVSDREIVRQSSQHRGDILVLEFGSNGGWDNDYDTLVAQYRQVISNSDCDDYLILGDTDDPGTSLADRDQDPFAKGTGAGETAWEAALHKAFGDRFINMRLYLVEHGLDVCGLKPTQQDTATASFGWVPHRLRADWTHLNSYGYYAKARGVYERGVQLGMWE